MKVYKGYITSDGILSQLEQVDQRDILPEEVRMTKKESKAKLVNMHDDFTGERTTVEVRRYRARIEALFIYEEI